MRKQDTNRKELVKLILMLAWPTILEQCLQTVVVYADTAMVGRIGAGASAAVGLITPVTWLINAPAYSLGVGVLAFVARNNGAKNYKELKTAAVQGIYLALLVGAMISAAVLGLSPFLPKWMGGDARVCRDASAYLAITGGAFVFKSLDMVLSCVIRGTGDTKTPMLINTMMNVINIIGNYFLIYESRTVYILGQRLFMPGANLGVAGAALGTAIASVFGGIAMLIAMWRNSLLSPKRESKRLNRHVMYQCVRVGLPLAVQRLAVFSGYTAFTSLVANLGTVTLAAHSIAITAEEMFYIPGFGMQDAGSTLIGNAMGEGDDAKTDHMAKLLILITVLIMTVTGTFLFLFPKFMMGLFTGDGEVIRQGVVALKMVAVSEPIYGALIMMEGIFNGVGNTKTTFVVGICTMWIVRVGMTYVCVHLLGLGLVAVWSCMIAENVTKAGVLGILFRRGYWKKGAVVYD
ncbi:putative efflux protein, MATE family [Lachnospiraceae bacterium XBB1006]|nr:putative efflux protein, MATE family [Lachnospiraceae bacterium XBB1006]